MVLRSRPSQNVKIRSSAVTAKKCTKKRDARAKLFFCQYKPIAFLPFLLTSPSSLLKLPNVMVRHLKLSSVAINLKLSSSFFKVSQRATGTFSPFSDLFFLEFHCIRKRAHNPV